MDAPRPPRDEQQQHMCDLRPKRGADSSRAICRKLSVYVRVCVCSLIEFVYV